ncbi:MAG: Nif3-like dinuclear metal center hexameric protein [Candidatus Woesearchaeota archaeon]
MEELKKITSFLDRHLSIEDFKDRSYNGLQVEGNSDVKKILFAVDAGLDTFRKALELKAEMIVVHHGLLWDGADPRIKDTHKERIDFLLRNKISLYAAHLPLDAHFDSGNNVMLLKLLGAKIRRDFHDYHGKKIGWIGEFKPPMAVKEIDIRLSSELGAKCTTLAFGREFARTVAVVSGGGGYSAFYDAVNEGCDIFITGDTVELYHSAKDENMNVIFAGHHATEILGVKELSNVIKKKFKVDSIFHDIPTGL